MTFAPDVMSQTIELQVVGDLFYEHDEDFFVKLSNATNSTVGDKNQGSILIHDNDTPPELSISDVLVFEGTDGNVTAQFEVTLSFESGKEISVHYTTADDTATVDSDFDGKID